MTIGRISRQGKDLVASDDADENSRTLGILSGAEEATLQNPIRLGGMTVAAPI